MLLSLSAVVRLPTDYIWYSFTGKRALNLPDNSHKDFSFSVETGDVFGLRVVGQKYHLIPKVNPGIIFKIDRAVGETLIGRSALWYGRVGKYAIKKPPKDSDQFVEPKRNTATGKFEDKELTARIHHLKIKGMDRAQFLLMQENIPNELTYYYDIGEAYKHFVGTKIPIGWGDMMESRVEKIAPDLDVECASINFLGRVVHMMEVTEIRK